MNFMSKKEEMTLKSYAEMAVKQNKACLNFNFWRKDFNKFRKFVPKGRIIDIGCGAGRDALLFHEYKPFYPYIGIDGCKEMIQEARRLVSGGIFMEMNMYELGARFEKDFFDGFWAVRSLLHIPKNKVLRIFQKNRIKIVLGEIRKVVKKNGIGFIVVKDGVGEEMIYDKKGENPRFFAFYGEKEFRDILEKNEFKVLRCEKDLKEYSPLTGNNTVFLKYFVKNVKK